MEIKTAKQCDEKSSLTPNQLEAGHIYRLVSGGPRDAAHGKYYIACATNKATRNVNGAVSLKTGYRLDGLFGGTTWEEVKGHVCLEE